MSNRKISSGAAASHRCGLAHGRDVSDGRRRSGSGETKTAGRAGRGFASVLRTRDDLCKRGWSEPRYPHAACGATEMTTAVPTHPRTADDRADVQPGRPVRHHRPLRPAGLLHGQPARRAGVARALLAALRMFEVACPEPNAGARAVGRLCGRARLDALPGDRAAVIPSRPQPARRRSAEGVHRRVFRDAALGRRAPPPVDRRCGSQVDRRSAGRRRMPGSVDCSRAAGDTAEFQRQPGAFGCTPHPPVVALMWAWRLRDAMTVPPFVTPCDVHSQYPPIGIVVGQI